MNILDGLSTSSRYIALMCLVDGVSGSQVLSLSVHRITLRLLSHAIPVAFMGSLMKRHTVSAQLEEGTSFWIKYELWYYFLQPGSKSTVNHPYQPWPESFGQVVSCTVPTMLLLPAQMVRSSRQDGPLLWWVESTLLTKAGVRGLYTPE